jgi:hypothetical protein
MSSEFEYTTYQDDEWPGVPENSEDADFDAADDEDDWHSASGWGTAGDRTEVLINQGRTSARGRRASGRRASVPQLGGHSPNGPGLSNRRHYGPRLYGTGLGGTGLGGTGLGGTGLGGTELGGTGQGGTGRGRNGRVPGGLGAGAGPSISAGRRGAGGLLSRLARLSRRDIIVAGGGVLALSIALAVILPGGGASWPASVATVKQEIEVACQNPDIPSDPAQLNFACAKDTDQILWVFALLTSDDNADFTDPATSRTGLEPITPSQGGEVAWSLNLHHPYNPKSPTDSLAVAARAINNIIGGATVTSQAGTQVVQPGLESRAANCLRYTGSTALVVRQGFPAVCARPVAGAAGEAALVSDVYQQWMVGSPSQDAANAALLFTNANNPGNPRVQAILHSLAAGQ